MIFPICQRNAFLRSRVAAAPDQRFRLVGVGLSNFIGAESLQPSLFEEF
jgi:hypothetical protein